MPDFEVVSPYEPSGDQPAAIATLVQGLHEGQRARTSLHFVGVEGAHAVEDHLEHRLVALAETALLM